MDVSTQGGVGGFRWVKGVAINVSWLRPLGDRGLQERAGWSRPAFCCFRSISGEGAHILHIHVNAAIKYGSDKYLSPC